MKTLIIFVGLLAFAISEGEKNYHGSGSYVYSDTNGNTMHITYVENDDGIKITSPVLTPEQEKVVIEQIKNQNQLLQQQLNQQFNNLNQQFGQFGQFNQQWGGFHPVFPFFGYGFPNFPNFPTFPSFNFPSFPFFPQTRASNRYFYQ